MTAEFFEKSKGGRGRVKHAILKRYLEAWFPILGQSRKDDLVYIDGFAGTGTYTSDTGEEPGSPIMVLDTIINHTSLSKIEGNIILLLIEKSAENAELLREAMEVKNKKYIDEGKNVAEKVKWEVINEEFAVMLPKILDHKKYQKCPMLLFADPFGFSGKVLPMDTLKRLLSRGTGASRIPTELFITVMDGSALRFISDPNKANAITTLMGKDNWRHLANKDAYSAPEERRTLFIDIYINNMAEGCEETLPLKFAINNERNCPIYHFVYFTTHIKGLQEMKRSMWKQTQLSDSMTFSEWGEKNPERFLTKMSKDEIVNDVANRIINKFRGETVQGSVLENFIWKKTPYIVNYKKELKTSLALYKINTARAFEKIQYRFLTTA